jgi:undecaprenyl-diphosphatase
VPGIVLVNPTSGPDDTSARDLADLFVGHDVEECAPERLPERVKEAVAGGADFVGIAGGDGTVRTAVEAIMALGDDACPLLVVPTGTRNHFAGDLGIGSVDDAVAATGSGRVQRVDVGCVNGRLFVNNSSVGIYPRIVVTRESQGRRLGGMRLPKGVATAVATYRQLRRNSRFSVAVDELDGSPFMAWMVFVGNGHYGDGLLDLSDRDTLQDGLLDVRIVRANHPLARARIVGALLLGRLARCPLVVRLSPPRTTLRLDRDDVEVALDGEVERLTTPLRYESRPGTLAVLIPGHSAQDR